MCRNYKLYKLEHRISGSFVSITDTAGLGIIQDEAFVARAHEATERVSAVSVLTDVLVLLALVDVLQNDGHTIRPVSRPARTQLIVFLRAGSRTFLATVAPSGADAAATRRLCHRRRYFKDALGLSGAVLVAREAKRLASICVSDSKSEIDKKKRVFGRDKNIFT